MFGGTCRLPGYLVGLSDDQAEALYDYGYNLGICFQLVDDLLDFTSSSDVLGKPVLSDLREGKLTLPLILTLPRLSDAERRKIQRAISERTFDEVNPEEVIELVNRFDGVDQTRDIAREYFEAGRVLARLLDDVA